MQSQTLEQEIQAAIATAGEHASNCGEKIAASGLAEAIEYCAAQQIDPPQCSLTAKSANADALRAKAARMLSDISWWERRLERLALGKYEASQFGQGLVTNFVSDATRSYLQSKRKR